MKDDVMSLKERQIRLTKMARRETYDRNFHAASVIDAIDTLNKIDNLYKQTVTVEHEVIHTFIFQLPDGTKFTPGLLPAPIEGQIVSEESINGTP